MVDDLTIARAVAGAALATTGVHVLGEGRYAEAATYGANDKVLGVVVNNDSVRVHVVAKYPEGTPVPELVQRIERQAAPHAEGRTVEVVVEDLYLARESEAGNANI
jgi:acylphosphatase